MSELTIDESIKDPNLIYIGRARTATKSQGLLSRLRHKIMDHLKNIASPHSGSQLDPAAKAAVDARWSLEVSWATARDDTETSAYEAALIRRYKAVYGCCPDSHVQTTDDSFVATSRHHATEVMSEHSYGRVGSPW